MPDALKTCETCAHTKDDPIGNLIYCTQGVTAPWSMRRELMGNRDGLYNPHIMTQEYVTPDFGCILHSDLDDDEMG